MKKNVVTRTVVYPHSPQRVWTALTDSSSLAQWLLPNDFVPRVGHRFSFEAGEREGWSGNVECEVVTVEPMRRLAYTWSAHPQLPAMLVSFTLEAVEHGTRLCLEQTEVEGVEQDTTLMRDALPSLNLLLRNHSDTMPRYFRVQVDGEALTDALFDFVTDPRASRNQRAVVRELHTFAPEMISVLETMILDGVDEWQDVADYVYGVFGHWCV